MKKNYIAPLVRAINIETEALIANSPAPLNLNEDPGDMDGGASNRRHSIWGDEY